MSDKPVRVGAIQVGYDARDKKWMAWVDLDREVSSGAGYTACTGDTYVEAVNKVIQAGSVEEYFEILKKEADEEIHESDSDSANNSDNPTPN